MAISMSIAKERDSKQNCGYELLVTTFSLARQYYTLHAPPTPSCPVVEVVDLVPLTSLHPGAVTTSSNSCQFGELFPGRAILQREKLHANSRLKFLRVDSLFLKSSNGFVSSSCNFRHYPLQQFN